MSLKTPLLLLAGACVQQALAIEFTDSRTTIPSPHSTKFVEFGIPPPYTWAGVEEEHRYATKLYPEYLPKGVPKGLIKNCEVMGSTALTFDDGPYIYTSHEVKGTFFINGDNWSRNLDDESTPWPALLRRMVDSGHQIGIHGWSHINMSAVDAETRYHEVHDLEVTLFNILGKYPTYFRPPYGDCNAECIAQLEGMGYHVVKWTVDTYDWIHNTPETWWKAEEAYRVYIGPPNAPFPAWMVLLHDVQEMTAVNTLPRILHRIHMAGKHRINLTVGDCLHDAPENWYRIPGADWDPNPSQRYWDVKAAEQAWYNGPEEDDGDE